MKKKLYYSVFLLLVMLCFGIVGCTKTDTNEITEEQKEEAAETFLNEFFSFNQEGRYDALSEALADIDTTGASGTETEGVQSITEETQRIYEDYYRAFADVATDNCVENMLSNRMLVKYDSLAAEQGIECKIANVECKSSDENSYTFEISFQSDEANELFHAPMKGRVTIESADGKVLVDSITLY
jgi:hypothetical protein